jgi:hypothetical protein
VMDQRQEKLVYGKPKGPLRMAAHRYWVRYGRVQTTRRASSVPDPKECVRELKSLYPDDYARNVIKTLFTNWPEEGFIKTGYASPRLGEIFGKGEKLNQPFHDLLFFAGEHTRMDLFGYMEGALRSGEGAAKLLMRHLCGMVEKPVSESPRVLVARAASSR